jgi:hypothetical protein
MNISMHWIKSVLFVSLFCCIGSQKVRAQDSYDVSFETSVLLSQELPFVQQDTLPVPIAQSDSLPVSVVRRPRLLPENLGFFERNLWTENGLFRTMGIASPLTPESRKSELKLRRTMLVAHEISGFVTLGLMVTTVYYGQKVLNEFNTVNYRPLLKKHTQFVDATIATYSITALLSLLSPPPVIRRDEISTVSYHRALAWVHVTGMILTPIIAAIARKGRGATDMSVLRIHQISGYITTSAFAASMIVMTF